MVSLYTNATSKSYAKKAPGSHVNDNVSALSKPEW